MLLRKEYSRIVAVRHDQYSLPWCLFFENNSFRTGFEVDNVGAQLCSLRIGTCMLLGD